MRLYLSVQRHRLPITNVAWAVPPNISAQAYTVSRLLEDVNNILPLETENWGLEDYIVEVGGFECLHFTPVTQLLKDDDHISIRPLQTAEVRARTITGRSQISEGGERLLDGVRFGRPLLRAPNPNRRPLQIPPAKRQRLLDDAMAATREDEDVPVMRLITLEGEKEAETNGVDLPNGYPVAKQAESAQRRTKNSRTVRFEQLPDENLDNEDEDDDFAPTEGDETSDVQTESSSEEESSDISDTSSSESESGSESDSTESSFPVSDSDESSGPEIEQSKPNSTESTSPGKGLRVTKNRNARRQASKKLNRLKASGVLDSDATLSDLRNWVNLQQKQSREPAADTASKKRKRNDEPAVIEEQSKKREEDDQAALERRKQLLIAQISEADAAPKVEPPTPKPARKRLRPDTVAINRILSRQTRPLEKQSQKPKPTPVVEELEAPVEPDFWVSKINLTAFECWHEGYELSAPPFPFKQHWDAASEAMRQKNKKKTKGQKVFEQPAQNGPHDAPDQEPTERLVLDYGKPEEDNTSAAIESQLRQDVATASSKPDLPPLPGDINSLPALASSNIAVGAIIVFKHFTMNPSNMNPEVSGFKTAVVVEEGDSGNGAGVIGLSLAGRDRVHREKKFDENGKRVYEGVEGFQMVYSEDEDEDAGLLELYFGELLEAKLLVPAPAVVTAAAEPADS